MRGNGRMGMRQCCWSFVEAIFWLFEDFKFSVRTWIPAITSSLHLNMTLRNIRIPFSEALSLTWRYHIEQNMKSNANITSSTYREAFFMMNCGDEDRRSTSLFTQSMFVNDYSIKLKNSNVKESSKTSTFPDGHPTLISFSLPLLHIIPSFPVCHLRSTNPRLSATHPQLSLASLLDLINFMRYPKHYGTMSSQSSLK